MVPSLSDSISLRIFIASIMHNVSPFLTVEPISIKGAESGEAAL